MRLYPFFPRASYLALAAGILPLTLCSATPAFAQAAEEQDDAAAETDAPEPASPAAAASASADAGEIVVTGSRIARPSLDAPIPSTNLSIAELTRSGTTNIGDVLQRLPALSASQNQQGSLGGGVSIGTTGLNILDLRNLGQARTLVLVDGQRHITSVEGEFLIDINTVPTALIQRVDVVTGGSSAVYGSDAMSGVVNFVLKDDFSGAQIDAQGGVSSRGDRGSYRVAGTFGKNFSEGRGNIATSLEYEQANPILLTGRDGQTGAFSGRNQFQRINRAGSGLVERTFLSGIRSFGYADGGAFIPYDGSSLLQCGEVAAACRPNGSPRVFLFQPNGDLAEANYGRDFRSVGSNNNQNGDGSTLNNTGVLVPSYKRYVANVLAHYDFSDAFRPYIQAKYVRTLSVQTSSPAFSQGGPQGVGQEYDGLGTFINVPIQLDNAFLTSQARGIVSSLLPAGSTFFNLNRNYLDLDPRGERDRRETFRIVGGVKGTFNDDWRYDVAVNYGHLKTRYLFTGNRIESRFYKSIDAVRNAAGQIVCRVNQLSVVDAACRPFDALGLGGTQQSRADRQAALDYFQTTSMRRGRASELDINGNMQGDTSGFFNLPGGPIRFAIGAEYRRETASYEYDDLVESGDTFLNAIQPFNPPAFKVKEAYAEIDVPIVRDKPFLDELSLSGAGRVADYSGATGTVWAYNGGAIYAPVRDIRLRVNYSRSVRAPTLGDLYSPASQDFRLVDDPCDPNFINNGTSTRPANCAAAGVPANFQAPQTRAGSLQIRSGGNAQLRQETSRSLTYGVVLQPRFIPGLSVTVDYFDIKIRNVISAVSTQQILDGCYNAASLDNAFCALIQPRNADGTFQLPALLESTLNFAAERATGIDLDVGYNRRIGASTNVAYRFIGTWNRSRNYFQDINDPNLVDRINGELGNPLYQFVTSLDVTRKALTIGYTLRYVGRQSIADWEQQHAVSGIPDTPFNPLYADRVYYPHAFYHDIRVSAQVRENARVYIGVDNLTDKLPPLGLLGTGTAGLNSGSTSTDTLYDNVGRFMYAGVSVRF